jgi:hypothetical protein
MSQTLFHLAFPVTDIAQTKVYYVDGLGCVAGRENKHALILNLYGHQLVAHMTKEPLTSQRGIYPRHFGLIFPVEGDWEDLLRRSHSPISYHQSDRSPYIHPMRSHSPISHHQSDVYEKLAYALPTSPKRSHSHKKSDRTPHIPKAIALPNLP